MKTLNFQTVQDVLDALNARFSFIDDFMVFVNPASTADNRKIYGGFYKMNYNGRPDGEYFFHDSTARIDDHPTLIELYRSFEMSMIQKLRWQKYSDEEYASETGTKVNYRYDYSILDEEEYPAEFTAVYVDGGIEKEISFKHYGFDWVNGYLQNRNYSNVKRVTGRWSDNRKEERIYVCDNLSDFVKKHSKADFMSYYYDSQKAIMDEKLLQAIKNEKLENPFDTVLELKDHLFELSTKISQNETN